MCCCDFRSTALKPVLPPCDNMANMSPQNEEQQGVSPVKPLQFVL